MVAISSEPLELKAMCSVMKRLISFPVTLKCLTLNDLEMPFYGKICFIVGLTRFFCLAFGDNCKNESRYSHTVSDKNVRQGL